MKKLLLFVTIFSVLFGISLFVAQKDAVFAFEENFLYGEGEKEDGFCPLFVVR